MLFITSSACSSVDSIFGSASKNLTVRNPFQLNSLQTQTVSRRKNGFSILRETMERPVGDNCVPMITPQQKS